MIYPLNSIVLYIPPDNRTDWSNRDMMTTAKHNRRIKLLGENKWDLGLGVSTWAFHLGQTCKLNLEVYEDFHLTGGLFFSGILVLTGLLVPQDFWSPADSCSPAENCSQLIFVPQHTFLFVTWTLFSRILFTDNYSRTDFWCLIDWVTRLEFLLHVLIQTQRDHPFKTLANFHDFWPLPPPVGRFLILSIANLANFWPLPNAWKMTKS